MSEHPALSTVVSLALRLTPSERARLIEQVAATLADESTFQRGPRRRSYGLLADFNLDVSSEDIDNARKDMLNNFPREDIV
jgi:hypothetical protein